jgi:hypothetical protein
MAFRECRKQELQLLRLDQEHAAAGMADRQWASTQPAEPPPTMTLSNCRLSSGAFIPGPPQQMICGGAQTPPQTKSLKIALGLGDQKRTYEVDQENDDCEDRQ